MFCIFLTTIKVDNSINNILEEAKNIAIIGCSKKEFRTSHQIAKYLQDAGYNIIPVHPDYDKVLNEKAYPTLLDIPEETKIDIVDIFRNKKFTEAMVDQAIERKEKTGQKPVIWTQMDVSSSGAKKKAEEAGFGYVKNKCLMVEHKRIEQ